MRRARIGCDGDQKTLVTDIGRGHTDLIGGKLAATVISREIFGESDALNLRAIGDRFALRRRRIRIANGPLRLRAFR